jgi:hypothetical protein
MVRKLKNVPAVVGSAFMAVMSAVSPVFASGTDWSTSLGDETGFVNMFNNIGGVYIKWAWFAGIIGALGWLLTKADEKKSAIFKGIAIGVIAGYIIFAIGGSNWYTVFSSVSGWFTKA